MGRRLENAKNLYMEAIRDGNVDAINKYTGSRYTQHSTPVKDGREGFVEFFEDFKKRNPIRDIEIVRSFEDGQYVFLHALQTLNGGEYRYVTADIFDTDSDGKLIEHWDIIDEVVPESVSGHTQVDGPSEIVDRDKTEVNKALIVGLMNAVFKGGDYARLTEFISEDTFVHHNPRIGAGLDGLRAALAAMASNGETIVYEETFKLIGSGNFVVTLSRVNFAGAPTAVIDIFRVDDGKIVEHWDVMETITPQETWVNSGKF